MQDLALQTSCKILMHNGFQTHAWEEEMCLFAELLLPTLVSALVHCVVSMTYWTLAENLSCFLCRRIQPWPSPVLIGNGTSKYRVSRLTVGCQISTMCTLPSLISQKAPPTARRARSSARSPLSLWVRNAGKSQWTLMQWIGYLVKLSIFNFYYMF